MKLSRLLMAGVVLSGFVQASDVQSRLYADGNDESRNLALRPSAGTESYDWLKANGTALQLNALTAENLPSAFDNRDNCSPVWDQAHLGSCTGFASKSAAELIWNIARAAQKDQFLASALFQYWNERSLEKTTDQDSGATIADAIRSLKQFGIAPDKDWDYSDYAQRYLQKPTDQAYADAKAHVDLDNIGHAEITQTPEAIKGALISNHAVIIGISVYESFMSPQTAKTGLVSIPNPTTEKLLGGHALLVVGYDDANKWYIVKNSWNATWGDQGYCYIPYAYMHNSALTSEIWGLGKMGPAGSAYSRLNPLYWLGY